MTARKGDQRAFDEHVSALAQLAGLLMRAASGGRGQDQIGRALTRAWESYVDLGDAIDRKEIVDYGLCEKVGIELERRAFPNDDYGLNEVVSQSLRYAAHNLTGAMTTHVVRARRGVSDGMRNYALQFPHRVRR